MIRPGFMVTACANCCRCRLEAGTNRMWIHVGYGFWRRMYIERVTIKEFYQLASALGW